MRQEILESRSLDSKTSAAFRSSCYYSTLELANIESTIQKALKCLKKWLYGHLVILWLQIMAGKLTQPTWLMSPWAPQTTNLIRSLLIMGSNGQSLCFYKLGHHFPSSLLLFSIPPSQRSSDSFSATTLSLPMNFSFPLTLFLAFSFIPLIFLTPPFSSFRSST